MSDLTTVKQKVRRMQSVVLNILCDIDTFCEENNITWYLSGGTCLGAVRHQGFIPWDDDGDIMLPRPDYEKFLRLFSLKYKGKYEVGSVETDKLWHRQYARVWDRSTKVHSENLSDREMGIFIDVFPIDGLPESRLKRKVYYKKLKVLCGLQNASIRTKYLENEQHVMVKTVAGIVTKPLGARFFTDKITTCAKRYDFTTSKYVGASTACHYGERETMLKQDMEKATRLMFEGHMFPVPCGYQNYLSSLYGDYMTIPKDAEAKGYSHLDHWSVDFGDN